MNDLGIKTTEWAFIEKVEDVSKNENSVTWNFENKHTWL